MRANDFGPAIAQAEAHGVRPEAGENRHVNSAGLPDTDHHRDSFWHARQYAGDTVAIAHAERTQQIANSVAQQTQILISHNDFGAVFANPVQCHACAVGVPINDGAAEIDGLLVVPAEVAIDCAPVEAAHRVGVARLGHGYSPAGDGASPRRRMR